MTTRIRDATGGDHEAIARLHWTVRREAFAGSVPLAVLDRKDLPWHLAYWKGNLAGPSPGPGLFALVLEDEGVLVGLAAGGPCAGEEVEGWTWILRHLYLLPGHQGRGHGRRLLEEAGARFRSLGADRFHLWTPSGNRRSRGFYEHLGGVLLREDVREDPEGTVRRVAYGWNLG